MNKRYMIALALLLFLLGAGVLLSLSTFWIPGNESVPDLLEISVIVREDDSQVFQAMRLGMNSAAEDYVAEIRFLTLPSENDTAAQRELLYSELDGGVDGIVLVPTDTQALAEDVKAITEQIPVVTLDADMTSDGAHAFISVSNKALGEALGNAAINSMSKGENVLLLNREPQNSGVNERISAAAAVLEEYGCIVNYTSGADEDDLMQALEYDLADKRPKAVIAFEASTLESAANLMRARYSQTLLYGMGATETITAHIESGRITGIAAPNEFAAGYLAVERLALAMQGQSPSPLIELEFQMVRKENMYDIDIQKFLFPVQA